MRSTTRRDILSSRLHRTRHVAGALLMMALLCMPAASEAEADVLQAVEDAFVARDESVNSWSIGNAELVLTVGLDSTGRYQVVRLVNLRADRELSLGGGPDTSIVAGGRERLLGSPADGFTFVQFEALPIDRGVQLNLVFSLAAPRLRVTRAYACYARAAVIETWTKYEVPQGSPDVSISGLNGWRVAIAPGQIHWLTGLKSDYAGAPVDDTQKQFSLQSENIPYGARKEFGAQGRSTEDVAPWITIDTPEDEFFGGLMWSGAWTASLERRAESLLVSIGLANTATTVSRSRPVEVPHAFFGITERGMVPVATRAFVTHGVRRGRPFSPPVIYNTWFAYGADIDEQSILAAMDDAARLGAEVFVLDAGWHAGAGRNGPDDFTSGLGSWTTDSVRFPSGLGALSDYADQVGVRFGIWVEPERVALSLVGRPGSVQERWLAASSGRYDPNAVQSAVKAAQICLADTAARDWVLARLVALIDEVHASYLKWDNNFWVNCNRPGHGHGTGDGNFAHVRALYEIFRTLRDRYPDLTIENVSGGGNRLDLEMLRWTDIGWMDDRTAPSSVVRHNIEGLISFVPPAYLLSFVLDHPDEPMYDGPDLPLYVRSRMMGTLGLTFRAGQLSEQDELAIAREIDFYRSTRGLLEDAAGILLTEQIDRGASGWDAVEQLDPATGEAVLFVFRSEADQDITVWPRGLRPDIDYRVYSADGGMLMYESGIELLAHGVGVPDTLSSGAHIILLKPIAAAF